MKKLDVFDIQNMISLADEKESRINKEVEYETT